MKNDHYTCLTVGSSHQHFCFYFVSTVERKMSNQGYQSEWTHLCSVSPLFSPLGHLCIGFTLCSGPLRLHGSGSDGCVSLGVQPHREDPGGLSI